MKDPVIEQMIEKFKFDHPEVGAMGILNDSHSYTGDRLMAMSYGAGAYNEFVKDDVNKKERIKNWPSIECPFFTDEEIDELEGYYSDKVAHESYHDYFNENGIQAMNRERDNAINKTYGQRVQQLQLMVQNAKSPEEADEYRQQLVDIGWNPEVEYNNLTQEMAKERFTRLMNLHENPTQSFIEAKKLNFPVSKNDKGDILISRNPDLESAYSQSHKLLLEYDKAHNYEGMKYETARMFYMNYLLEKKIYHKRHAKNREANIRLRSKILNDFKKYIKIILEHEPSFNFDEYYKNTPFYPYTVVVDSSIGQILKDILGSII